MLIRTEDQIPAITGSRVARPGVARANKDTLLRLKFDTGTRGSRYIIEADPERDVALVYDLRLDALGYMTLSSLEVERDTEGTLTTRDEAFTEVPLRDVEVKAETETVVRVRG